MQGGQQDGIHLYSGMDGTGEKMDAYRECIRENIDYQCFRPQDMGSVDELVELIADTMLVPDRGTVRVAGAEKSDSGDRHIKSILSRMSRMEKGQQAVVAQTVNALADALEKSRQG